MSTVNANVRLGYQNAAWFTTNAAVVLLSGQIVYRSTDGKYIIGDGSTAISGLTFYGGVSSSGLTVGTSTITGGTNTKILYNNSGVLGEYSVTGTGTTAVLSTSPTFTTDITTPKIIGGTDVGSYILLQSTTGAGTATGKAIDVLGGTNGATALFTALNSSWFGINNQTPLAYLDVASSVFIHSGNVIPTGTDAYVGIMKTATGGSFPFDQSGSMLFRPRVSTTAGRGSIYFYSGSPTAIRQHITENGSVHLGGAITAAAGVGAQMSIITAQTSGALSSFLFTNPAHTNQTLSTNIPNFKVTGSTKQWATGALATQYFNYFSANTVSFVGASTATNVYGLYVEAATAGTNATITNNYAAGFSGGGVKTAAGTTAYASLNIPHGSAPTTPVDGDIWTTTAGLYVRINGVTVGPLS